MGGEKGARDSLNRNSALEIGINSLSMALRKMVSEHIEESHVVPVFNSQRARIWSSGEGELVHALRKLSKSWRHAAAQSVTIPSSEVAPLAHRKLNMKVSLLEEEDSKSAGGTEEGSMGALMKDNEQLRARLASRVVPQMSSAMQEDSDMVALMDKNEQLRNRLAQQNADLKLIDLLRAQKDELSADNVLLHMKLDRANAQLMSLQINNPGTTP